MNILAMKHFEFDDESAIVTWARSKNHSITTVYPPQATEYPDIGDFDLLVILGGPMSVYQVEQYAWLTKEKEFVRESIRVGKCVLGICFGAQMLAELLGGSVYRNRHKEIGWHPVRRTGAAHPLFDDLPETFYSFHWHGDTFDLPEGATRLAYSEACRNQAFACGDRVLGLQFHLETTASCMQTMLAEWAGELVQAPYVQQAAEIVSESRRASDSAQMLHRILDKFERLAGQESAARNGDGLRV